MKEQLASIIRHWLTLGLTALTVFLGAHLLMPDEAKALDGAARELVAPLAVIGTLLVTAAWRVALTWMGKFFRTGSGENGNGGGASGGAALLLLGTAAVLGGLPSCSPSLPVRIGVETDYGRAAYSSKGGVSVEIDASAK